MSGRLEDGWLQVSEGSVFHFDPAEFVLRFPLHPATRVIHEPCLPDDVIWRAKPHVLIAGNKAYRWLESEELVYAWDRERLIQEQDQ